MLPGGSLSPQEIDRFSRIRSAILTGDRSKVSTLIEDLKSPNSAVVGAALRLLGGCGDPAAVPAMEAVETSVNPIHIRRKARANRARILADVEAEKQTTPGGKAAARVRTLLAECGLTIDAVNQRSVDVDRRSPGYQGWLIEHHVLEILAQYALAHGYETMSASPEFRAANFSLSASAKEIIELSRLQDDQRVAAVIDRLARTAIIRGEVSILIQIAQDMGDPALLAAKAKLMEMKQAPARYPWNGFTILIRIVEGVGSRDDIPLLDELSAAVPGTVTDASAAKETLAKGWLKQELPGY